MRLAATMVLLVTLAVVTAVAQGKDGELEKLMSGYSEAVNAKDPGKVAGLFAEDGVLMAPDEPMVKGSAAIRAFYETRFKQPHGTLALQSSESLAAGQVGRSVGWLTETTGNPGGLLTLGVGGGARKPGKYVTLFKRVGKEWRIAYFIWNYDAAATTKP